MTAMPTDAEKLKQALQKMPETGAMGFEGLLKRLLELSLNEEFVLARGGDQPSGDAHNTRRTVCVQAKRYKGASPQAKNIEGDFDENLRVMPNTDIYVLGVTRESAQLNDTLDAMREKSAVDIVVLDFAADDSALPVLCVEYWAEVQGFVEISAINNELAGWVSAVRLSSSHKVRVEKLHLALRECTQTLEFARRAARSYLSRRFQLATDKELMPLQPIRLSAAVERPRYSTRAVDWWSAKKERVLVFEAPESVT